MPGHSPTSGEGLRVLVLEGGGPDALPASSGLQGAGFDLLHAPSVSRALELLGEERVDCVLVDLMPAGGEGLEALEALTAAAPGAAVVVVGGSDDESVALRAVQRGAQDYVVKARAGSELLRRSVRYAADRKRSELLLARLALHDPLTGLPNRALLHDRLAQALARARRKPDQHTVVVLSLDIDRFKLVNDTLGHRAGDRVLVELGERISRAVRPGDTVARFGGDEFVVLCEELASADNADSVAKRVLAALAEPVDLGGIRHHVSVSMGIAVASGRSDAEPDTLLSNADAAMYRAKARGGGTELFSDAMRVDAARQLALHSELHRALDRGELVLHYQPQMGIGGAAAATGVEALVRWQHPVRGLLAPAEFVPLAEETGLIVRLGAWVLRTACEQLARWRASGVADEAFMMNVNLSARQLAQPDILDVVRQAVEAAGVPPNRLCLEITETTVMEDAAVAVERLHALKALGVRLAIDDFGRGYSSLTHMHRFPVDVLKIDRSFISDCDRDEQARDIVEVVIRLARALGLTPVAEGVESAGQADELRLLGCPTAQGFLFAQAQPPDALVGLLQRHAVARAQGSSATAAA